MLHRIVLVACVLLGGAGWLPGQVPVGERIPVRDPERLKSMGFPADATNVYVWSKADLSGNGGGSVARPEDPETWGTALGFSNVYGYQLGGRAGAWLDRTVAETECYQHYLPYGHPADAYLRIPVPDGAALKQLLFWAYDGSDTLDLDLQLYEQCQADGVNPQTSTLLAELFTILSIGDYFGFTTLNDLTVDNRNCGYTVRVRFAQLDQDCQGGFLRLQKIQLAWERQVSPGPAVASFNDVPTSHPFFQFVEALKKSGTTGGCNSAPPLFCPDQPLTRGQMAVFLAKALGLQWP